MDESRRIAPITAVPTDSTLLATIDADDHRREVILTRLGDNEVVAWENHCQHWVDTPLDRGDGAMVRDGEIVCAKHGAIFERDTGTCVHGPCLGTTLDPIAVTTDDGNVYLAEDGWTVEELGPADDHDRSSRGGLDF